MLAASLFGLYGIILAYIMINIHFVNLRSFGVPYSAPFAPLFFKDWKDLILRAPATYLKGRPELVHPQNSVRMNDKGDGDNNEMV
jgi:spore germination protein